MTQRLTKLAAALMILPLSFIGVVALAAMSGSVEELYLESFFTSPLGEAVVVLGPFAALALVLIPAVRISVDHSEPAPVVAVTLRLGRFQLLVALVAAAVAVLFLGYYFVENYTLRVPR